MIEYLQWLSKCNGQTFRVTVKFTNFTQKDAIAEGRADLEEILFLIAQLSEGGQEMEFDNYHGHIRKFEIDIEKCKFKITAELSATI
jgi:hypothetical protein